MRLKIVFGILVCALVSTTSAAASKKGARKDPLFQFNGQTLAAVLGVQPDAKEVEVKEKYRPLIAKYHPDRAGGHEEIFKLLKLAYETLVPVKGSRTPSPYSPTDVVEVTQKKGGPAEYKISTSMFNLPDVEPQTMRQRFEQERQDIHPGMTWEEFLDRELHHKIPEGKTYIPEEDAYIDHVTSWKFVFEADYNEYVNRSNPIGQVLYYIPEHFALYSPKWDGFLLPYNAKWRGIPFTDPEAWILARRVRKIQGSDRVTERVEGTKVPGGAKKFYSEETENPVPYVQPLELKIDGSAVDFMLSNKMIPIESTFRERRVFFSLILKTYFIYEQIDDVKKFKEIPGSWLGGNWEYIDDYRAAHPADVPYHKRPGNQKDMSAKSSAECDQILRLSK